MDKENLTIKDKNTELTNRLWNEYDIETNIVNIYKNHYIITFQKKYTNKKISFDFTDSIYNLENDISLNLLDVLACLLSLDYNCVNGVDFYDFCNNLGYNRDSLEVLNVYKKCLDNMEKVNLVFGKDIREKLIKEYNLDNY